MVRSVVRKFPGRQVELPAVWRSVLYFCQIVTDKRATREIPWFSGCRKLDARENSSPLESSLPLNHQTPTTLTTIITGQLIALIPGDQGVTAGAASGQSHPAPSSCFREQLARLCALELLRLFLLGTSACCLSTSSSRGMRQFLRHACLQSRSSVAATMTVC